MRRAIAALALSALLAPGAARADDPWFGRDKLVHGVATLNLTFTGYAAAAAVADGSAARLATGAVVGLAAGLTKELIDRQAGGRISARDLAWDAVGTATGLLAAWLVERLLHRTPAAAAP